MEQSSSSASLVNGTEESILPLASHATSTSTLNVDLLPIESQPNPVLPASTEITSPVHSSNSTTSLEPNSPIASTSTQTSPTSSPAATNGSTQPARRVKLYRLKDDQWIDLGTGNCMGILIDATTSPGLNSDEGAWIVVSKEGTATESKPAEVLLKSLVQCSGFMSDEEEEDLEQDKVCNIGVYQKQQDTLIVWTDKVTEMEMALSFATTSGCAEIWQFIKHARKWQGSFLHFFLLYDVTDLDGVADQTQRSPSLSPGVLSPQPYPYYNPMITRIPELSLATIEQVENTIRALGRTAVGRERTASAIIKGEFVQKLIKIQVEAEDLESLEDLHSLCRVMQTIRESMQALTSCGPADSWLI